MIEWYDQRHWTGGGEGAHQVGRRVEEGRKMGTVISGTGLTVSIRWDRWWDRFLVKVKNGLRWIGW